MHPFVPKSPSHTADLKQSVIHAHIYVLTLGTDCEAKLYISGRTQSERARQAFRPHSCTGKSGTKARAIAPSKCPMRFGAVLAGRRGVAPKASLSGLPVTREIIGCPKYNDGICVLVFHPKSCWVQRFETTNTVGSSQHFRLRLPPLRDMNSPV